MWRRPQACWGVFVVLEVDAMVEMSRLGMTVVVQRCWQRVAFVVVVG